MQIADSDFTYLRGGGVRQQRAYAALESLDIAGVLQAYNPVLAGTIPLGIETSNSDLDIICQAANLDAFITDTAAAYGHLPGFMAKRKLIRGVPSVVVNFHAGGFPVELFAQDRPPFEQNAVRHMLVEARLLELGGEAARAAIHELKANGMKTEPAFAVYFGLLDNPADSPYETLLELSELDDAGLRDAISADDDQVDRRPMSARTRGGRNSHA